MEDGSGIHNLAADLSISCAAGLTALNGCWNWGFEPPQRHPSGSGGAVSGITSALQNCPGAEMLLIYPKPPDSRLSSR